VRRLAFILLSVLSLLLFITTIIIWVRSYWVEDQVVVAHEYSYAGFASFRGSLGCEFGRWYERAATEYYTPRATATRFSRPADQVPPSDYVHFAEAEGRFANLPHYHDAWGFRWHPRLDGNGGQYSERGIAVPMWFLAIATATLPAMTLARVARRARRGTPGRCVACGYDLRATPGRCPECGAMPKGVTPTTP
jgi:hypothetical protein